MRVVESSSMSASGADPKFSLESYDYVVSGELLTIDTKQATFPT